MEGIKFNRFKKKSLILLHEVLDNGEMIKKINNRKLLQILQTLNYNKGIVEEQTLKDHSLAFICLNDNKIAFGSDQAIKVWDVITGNCLRTLEGHSEPVNSLFAINKNKILSCSFYNCVKIWDVIAGKCLKTLQQHSVFVGCLIKINKNKFAIVIGNNSVEIRIKIWDVLSGNYLTTQ